MKMQPGQNALIMDIMRIGKDARSRGDSQESNPYDIVKSYTSYTAWDSGWLLRNEELQIVADFQRTRKLRVDKGK